MNRNIWILLIGFLLLFGCSSDEAPEESTIDTQMRLQTRLDMEKWFLNIRFIEKICSQVSDSVSEIYNEAKSEVSSLAVESAINHFNTPNGLIDRLKELVNNMELEENRLESISDKDTRIFDNLKVANQLLGSYIELISTIPESADQFAAKKRSLTDQLNSIIKNILIEYPQSTDDFDSMITMENMDYRWFARIIQEMPKPPEEIEDIEEQEAPLPTPTPTSPPLQTWRDANGNIHMGYNPPEGVEILTKTVPKEPISDKPVDEPSEKLPDESLESRQSMIWVDENGITHMGQQVPEGYKGKPASDIPLMITQ
ncbi:MAG: hypothetical protein WBM02_06865 [bacterium]